MAEKDAHQISLWSLNENFSNRFIIYLTGGMALVYLLFLLITYCAHHKTPKIINLLPEDGSVEEKKLHKYLLIVDTSIKRGASCSKETSVYFQLVGEKAQTGYISVSVFTDGIFILQSGLKDLLLIKTEDLGDVLEVKIVIDNEKWRPERVEVVKISTGQRFLVPARVIYSGSNLCPENGVVYPVTNRSVYSTIILSVLRYHHWITIAVTRFGAITPIVSILFIFVGISTLLVGTLIVYILVAPKYSDDSVRVDLKTLEWTTCASWITFVTVSIFEILMRNVKSGYLPDIKKYKEQMFDNEEKPKKLSDNDNGYKVDVEIDLTGHDNDFKSDAEIDLPEHDHDFKSDAGIDLPDHINDFKSDAEIDLPELDNVFKRTIDIKAFSRAKKSNNISTDDCGVFQSQPMFNPSTLIQMDLQSPLSSNRSDDILIPVKTEKKCNDDMSSKSQETIKLNQIINAISNNVITEPYHPPTLKDLFHSSTFRSRDKSNSAAFKEYKSSPKQDVIVEEKFDGLNNESIDETPKLKDFIGESTVKPRPMFSYMTTFSDLGLNKKDDQGNVLLMTESEEEMNGVDRVPSLEKILFEWSDEFDVCDEYMRAEFVLFLKQLIRSIKNKIKYLNMMLRKGDTSCFTGLEVQIRKWCHLLRAHMYKLIFSATFRTGIYKAVVQHNIEMLPQLRESVESSASRYMCTMIEVCHDKLTTQKSLSRPDIEEIFNKIINRLYKMVDIWVQSILFPSKAKCNQEEQMKKGSEPLLFFSDMMKENHINPTTVSSVPQRNSFDRNFSFYGITEYLTQRGTKLFLTSEEYQVIYTLALCVIRLSFKDQEWILREDWDRLTHGPTPEYMEVFFRQQQIELLTVWKMCSNAIEEARKELLEEYADTTIIYTQFFVRQLALTRLDKLSKDQIMRERYQDIKNSLSKRWHKQGFHQTLNATEYLAEVFLSQYIANVKDENITNEDSPFYILSQSPSLHRLKKQLQHELMIHIQKKVLHDEGPLSFLSKHGLKSIYDRGDCNITDYTDVMIDVAIEQVIPGLPKVAESLLTEEILANTAANIVRKVVDNSRHIIMLENQMEVIEPSYEVTMINELKSAAKDLEPLMLYLKHVRNKIHKVNTVLPETYVEKMEEKHKEFAVVNIQNVLDACLIWDDDFIDRSITRPILYELEWDTMGENVKCIPHWIKSCLVFVMFFGVLFNLLYVTFVGGQLNVTQIKEWLIYWLYSVAIYGFAFLPLLAVFVGFVIFRKQK